MSSYTSTSQPIVTDMTQRELTGQETSRSHGRTLLTALLPVIYSLCFLVSLRTTNHSELGLPTSIIYQESAPPTFL